MNKKHVEQFAESFVKFCIALHFVSEYGVDVTMTVGPSMLPTLSLAGDTLLVDRRVNLPHFLSKYSNSQMIRVGDVVISKSPSDASQTVCKRVIAVGGERLYGKIIPPGKVWIEGDNKRNSTDSRSYGALPLSMIEGKVICRLWPLHKIGTLSSSSSL